MPIELDDSDTDHYSNFHQESFCQTHTLSHDRSLKGSSAVQSWNTETLKSFFMHFSLSREFPVVAALSWKILTPFSFAPFQDSSLTTTPSTQDRLKQQRASPLQAIT